jgi:hypothetical protein
VKREYTILVDEREKKPFTFPEHIVCMDPTREPWAQQGVTVRLRTQKRTMKTGDYRIDGQPAVVERKGSIDEIAQNLLTPDGRRRFADCCRRLRDDTPRPALLLEGLVGMPVAKAGKPHPGIAIDALMRILQEHGIHLMVLPTGTPGQRRAAGEWAARWLITQEHNVPSPAHDRRQELQHSVVDDGNRIGRTESVDHHVGTAHHGSRELDGGRHQPELPEGQGIRKHD